MKKNSSHSIDKIVKFRVDDPIYQLHEYKIDAKNNHIYLMGEEIDEIIEEPGVEYIMASRFIRNLNILMRRSTEPILIHMKTNGGSWEEGMAIYDMIKACPNPITILSYTHARSMSSIILQAANKRVLMPHSTFMFHEGTIVSEGTVKQVETEMEQNQLANEQMIKIYVKTLKRFGKMKRWSKTRIAEWLKHEMDRREDVYLTPIQAVEYGFADEVFGADGNYHWDKLLEFTKEQLETH